MNDQANLLRDLMEQRFAGSRASGAAESPHRSYVTAITSGKGGVGKSHIALNLAVSLANAGQQVCLIDANFGLGNLDLLAGVSGRWHLGHVIDGTRQLNEILIEGPAGIRILPAGSDLYQLEESPELSANPVFEQLRQLDQNYDFIILDTPTALCDSVRRMTAKTDLAILVTTTEATAIADTYSALKSLASLEQPLLMELLVNCCDSEQDSRTVITRLQRTALTFLAWEPQSAGFLPTDDAVKQAVEERVPFQLAQAQSPAARAIARLSQHLLNLRRTAAPRAMWFQQTQTETKSLAIAG